MSYCRWGQDSDVYVFESAESGEFVCFGCCLDGPEEFSAPTRHDMATHLLAHRRQGHKVPEYAIERLRVGVVA